MITVVVEMNETTSLYASGEVIEDVEIELEGFTYTFDLDTVNNTACMTDISEPAQESVVTVPETFEYNGEVYTTTELSWGFFSSDIANVTGLILPNTLEDANVSFSRFPDLKELTIPGSVKNFDGDFQYMKNLQTLTFSEGVEEISANSMVKYCTALTTVNLPSTLKQISAPAVFSGASALQNISLPDGLVITEGSLFSDCTALTNVDLPASITEIPASTFSGCTNLQSVTAQGTITNIGLRAFNECTNLMTIPDLSQVTNICEYAFEKCESLTGPVDFRQCDKYGWLRL